MVELDAYIMQKLREGKKVKIEISTRDKDGYLEMDWIIDDKLMVKDFPFEVFEGEDATLITRSGKQ